MKVNWIITDNNITVDWMEGGKCQVHTVSRSDSLAERLILALKEKRMDEIPGLVSAAKRIEQYSDGKFQVVDGQIMINGVAAPSVLGGKILKFSEEGLPYEPLVKFAANLQQNPSFRAVNELYQFLEKNDHPLTENGNFIAYKKVRDDYMDVHSGTFDNHPGNVIEMPRNQVNEDSTQTCSNGLHVANFEYASNFYAGGLMLAVEVNPADVVSIPVDYNQSKMRVCKYKVLSVVDRELSDTSLRVTGSTEGWTINEVDEEPESHPGECRCTDCGCETIDDEGDHCVDCGEQFSCTECGATVCCDEELCDDCEEAAEVRGETDDKDPYPWEDELD